MATHSARGAARGSYDPLIGVWSLNINSPQTKFGVGFPLPKSQTYKFVAAAAGGVKFVGETIAADGKRVHSEYEAQLDGRDYRVSGDGERDSVALKRVKPFITEGTTKKSGSVVSDFSIVIWGN